MIGCKVLAALLGLEGWSVSAAECWHPDRAEHDLRLGLKQADANALPRYLKGKEQ